MGQFELRVHFAAPSMVKDDARWQSVARGIARFEAARRVNFSDSIADTTNEASCFVNDDDDDTTTSTRRMLVSPRANFTSISNSASRAEATDSVLREGEHDKKRRRAVDLTTDNDVRRRTKRTSFARAKQGLNPAFRNPLTGSSGMNKGCEDTPRPRTAPEVTVLVPVTESPKIRRTLSDKTGAATRQSRQGLSELSSTDLVDESSFVSESSVLADSLQVQPLVMPATSSENNSFEKHRYPANQGHLWRPAPAERSPVSQQSITSRLSQTSFDEHDVELGTRLTNSEELSSTMHAGHGVHHDARTSLSPPSTETASDPTRYLTGSSSPLAQRTAAVTTPLVDLSTQLDESVQQVTRRDVLGPVSSPVHIPAETGEYCTHSSSGEARLNAVLELPRRIRCRASDTMTSRPFTSSVPQYLKDLASNFDLANHFRPVRAPKSIRNIERGYWKLLIEIVDMATAAKARRSPLTLSQWSDRRFMLRQEGHVSEFAATAEGDAILRKVVYPYVQPDTAFPWTADEFLTFWKYLAKIIERGRAGYDVRATINRCEKQNEGGLLLEVRLSGWAETLSHQWLILRGVSGDLTCRMPLQWFGPGKGALITMSGQLKRGGTIGRWVEKVHGADGYWGLEDAWEGLSSSSPPST